VIPLAARGPQGSTKAAHGVRLTNNERTSHEQQQTHLGRLRRPRTRGRGKKDIWARIGAAWPFQSGSSGFTVQLDALPIGDRIVLAEPKADEPDAPAEAG
jgi:hypothetical protein